MNTGETPSELVVSIEAILTCTLCVDFLFRSTATHHV